MGNRYRAALRMEQKSQPPYLRYQQPPKSLSNLCNDEGLETDKPGTIR